MLQRGSVNDSIKTENKCVTLSLNRAITHWCIHYSYSRYIKYTFTVNLITNHAVVCWCFTWTCAYGITLTKFTRF